MRSVVLAIALVIASVAVGPERADARIKNYSTGEESITVVYAGPGALEANLDGVRGRLTVPDPPAVARHTLGAGAGASYATLSIRMAESKLTVHMVTLPQAPAYAAERKKLLADVDGIVFVASADPKQAKANRAALSELRALLAENGYDLELLSVVVQVDRTGVARPVAHKRVAASLGLKRRLVIDAVPASGVGVVPAFRAITLAVMSE